jgi:hypothetical protein
MTGVTQLCLRRFSDHHLRVLACICESRNVFDLAFEGAPCRLIVRCVYRAAPTDYRALRTMIRDGDFDRAVLVYCDEEQPHLSDEIESWPISRIEELAKRLAGEARR